MLGVGLWSAAKGNSHMGKGYRVGASVYFGHLSSFIWPYAGKESLDKPAHSHSLTMTLVAH